MNNIQLTGKDILDKDFKSSMKGYNKDEVDQFLDTVIQDYEAYEQRVRDLEQQLEQARSGSRRETRVNSQVQEESPDRSMPQAGGTNYDILKRLSNLEKEVFGKKSYEQ
ncbi:cell division regulator GpsB [Salibacterium halotolerans]|uniref:DivIVA domain-containing protein n=1 Tax=Salibacterium halotolerans TaxID=1884432 RepID=A0A1I5UTG4_9BACI|nr:cell division regulator GpsB [Salibacterium halotolerans]SFP98016.1 DivIVA domain-containing protein [Salibacterium halotolerans]